MSSKGRGVIKLPIVNTYVRRVKWEMVVVLVVSGLVMVGLCLVLG